MAGWICSYFVYYAYMSAQKKSVYIETTIPSFATAKTSRDAIIAGHQAATILDCFHLSCSVLAEIDYLLSWNCAHLGVSAYSKIKDYNQTVDLHTPMLLTPEVLMEIEGSL